MHELGITQDIIEIVSQRAGSAKVLKVTLEIGKLSAVLPDAIRFCFDVCAEGTVIEGADLEIQQIPGRANCRTCNREVVLDEPWGICECGSTDLEWLSGTELKIREMEVV